VGRRGALEEGLFALLGRWDNERSPAEVLALGSPALRRLLDAKEGKGALRGPEVEPRDYEDALQAAIAAFGASDLDAVLAEMYARGWHALRIASSGLARVADPRVAAMLVGQCSSETALDRLQAVQLLGMQRDPRATEALVRALSDRSQGVRYAAVQSLGEAGDPAAIVGLQTFAKRCTKARLAKDATAAIARIRQSRRGRGTIDG
jgi:hypothetical protein